MNLKSFLIFGTILATPLSCLAEEFSISFEWGDIKKCNTGNPNRVSNPIFTLNNVPEGTKFIKFKMKDKNVPSFNHGGGKIEYFGENVIEPGAFKYKSPCPPGGAHTYEWTVTAQSKKSGGKLAVAKAKKKYP